MGNIFLDRKINLICANPNFKLLDKDGNLDFMGGMLYDNVKNIAANETKIRTESSKRGIREAADKNKFIGGDVILGYMIDKNNDFQYDPETKDIVWDIFEMYKSGLHSFSSIKKEIESKYNKELESWYHKKENDPKKRKEMDRMTIGSILSNEYYVGDMILKEGYKFPRQFPKIIDRNTFVAVQRILKLRSGRKSDRCKNIFYASRLLKCPHCHETLVAFYTSNQYQCKSFLEKRGCTKGFAANLNLIDSLALIVARIKDQVESVNMNENKIIEINKKIDDFQNRVGRVNT
jgi:hypothetical protein